MNQTSTAAAPIRVSPPIGTDATDGSTWRRWLPGTAFRSAAPGRRRSSTSVSRGPDGNRGEAIGLLGVNGSGKSTLLLAIAGLFPPTSGKVYTRGQPSLLGVNAALMNDLTGERNVVLGCLATGMTRAEVRDRYDDIVRFSGINDHEDFISLPMRTYSSGMGARLRFAVATANSHDVLLIDEALATGDADFRRRGEARSRELRQEAGTVFLVSHSLGVIRESCERSIWVDQGRIVADGDTDSVVNAYNGRHDPDALAARLATTQPAR